MNVNNFYRIPEEMRNYLQWVVWKFEDRGSSLTKVPYCCSPNEELASVADPRTWGNFNQAVETCKLAPFDGIGFVFTQADPYSGIDLDDIGKKVAAGAITQLEADMIMQHQLTIYREFISYAERSPSGKGLHIILKGKVPTGRRRSAIEIYSDKRFFTMTGDVYRDAQIEPHQDLLMQLWQQMGKGRGAEIYDGNSPQKEPDEEIIKRALNADNGEKFSILLAGKWLQLYESQSQGDFAFIDIIAFYTQNREQIERIFRASPLGQRKKAQRADYVGWMIHKSFDNQLPPIEIENLNQQLKLGLEAEAKEIVAATVESNAVVATPEHEPLIPGLEEPIDDVLETLPKGLVGDIASYIYQSSNRPLKEVALCAALGLMAGICGRCYNTNTGAGLNLYILLLAQTGTGKEAISLGPTTLINTLMATVPNARDFIGPSNFQSMPGMVKWLAKHPSIISTMNEFGLAICQMSGPRANPNAIQLKKSLLELYPKSGANSVFDPIAYSDKDKNTPVIASPALSILGESVPEEFYRHLDETVISGGLLPRFICIEVPSGIRPYDNEQAGIIKPEIALLDKLADLVSHCLTLNSFSPRRVLQVQQSPEAAKLLRDFNDFCDAQMRYANDKDLYRQLWNRTHLKALKLASLLAVGCDVHFPVITFEQAQWAKKLVIKDVLNMLNRLARGDIGQGENFERKQIEEMCSTIKAYFKLPETTLQSYRIDPIFQKNGLVPWAFLQRKLIAQAMFRNDKFGPTNALKRTVQTLLENGVLVELPKNQMIERFNGRTLRAFMVQDMKALVNAA